VRGVRRLVLAALCVGMSSCSWIAFSPTPSDRMPEIIWPPGELIRSLSERQDRFRSVRGLARVQYSGPEGSGGFQEAILVQRPDRLRLETLSYLGAILIVTVDGQQIVGFHPREGLFFRGQSSSENLLRYTQIPLELPEVTALLLGLPPVELRALWRREKNSLVRDWDGGGKEVVTFDSQTPVPNKWERFGPTGEIQLSAQFAEYKSSPAGLFPLKISVEAHTHGKRLEILYEEPELNVTLPLALFIQEKPASAKEVSLESIGG
jgi:hypothetical protein